MNGWPEPWEVDAALALGTLLNVGRCAPWPGESAKRRIARGMSIAAPYVHDRRSIVERIDEAIVSRVYADVRGHDWMEWP